TGVVGSSGLLAGAVPAPGGAAAAGWDAGADAAGAAAAGAEGAGAEAPGAHAAASRQRATQAVRTARRELGIMARSSSTGRASRRRAGPPQSPQSWVMAPPRSPPILGGRRGPIG